MMLIFFISLLVLPVNANLSNKLDETSMPQAPVLGMKCTTCSCANPCDSQLPSPPPPPPPSSQQCNPIAPPPPRFVYFTSPLPLAVPPPPERFVYFSSPPGNSYGTDPSDLLDIFVGGIRSDAVSLRDLVGFALLQVFTF
ncbi:hypothetical protein RHMOL_Rhmol10G0098200 [Rhododendron molle]|uniref:Uncharacterized protein n=1 Tax=Rhododendron molle TaxID=49168 RepID=A0ACC0M0V9_RHOML|nr:hypothetical protein RHMOL_Rhmol10G0098200 [Rhododendron molle]